MAEPLADATSRIEGFRPPWGAGPTVDEVNAGRVLPVQCRVVDAAGAPVTDPARIQLRADVLDCSTQQRTGSWPLMLPDTSVDTTRTVSPPFPRWS